MDAYMQMSSWADAVEWSSVVDGSSRDKGPFQERGEAAALFVAKFRIRPAHYCALRDAVSGNDGKDAKASAHHSIIMSSQWYAAGWTAWTQQ
jgi:hypothetical protein